MCEAEGRCGLDRLNWKKVKSIISDIFCDVDITIKIYSLSDDTCSD